VQEEAPGGALTAKEASANRRPLLAGADVIITTVEFCVSGTMIDAVLPSTLISGVSQSFRWGQSTLNWAGPVGSEGVSVVDVALTVFNP
jgi:hypothetical protein